MVRMKISFQAPMPYPYAKPSGKDAMSATGPRDVSQHAGELGYGLSAAASLLLLGARLPLVSKLVPGLNLGVAALEGYNSHKAHLKGDTVGATIHLGNSLSCLSGFLEESGALALSSRNSSLGAALALAGGGLGLGVGIYEMHLSTRVENPVEARKTLALGLIDTASGIASLTAGVLTCAGVGGNLGVALFAASSACDLASLGVDYLGHKIPGIRARE
jgi:hypothetical protein